MDYKDKWEQGISYEEYVALVNRLLLEGKSTGPNSTPELAHYSELNVHRMHRLGKTYALSARILEAFKGLKAASRILVITEGWCGDASQIVPVIAKMAQECNIPFRCVLRDEHPDLMDLHLTNGAKSIPIFIVLDQDFTPLFSWGPRPEGAQVLLAAHKANPDESHDEFVKKVQLWYAQDKQQSIEREWIAMLSKSRN